MATNPATVNDLGNRSLRTLTPVELTSGDTLLDDAWSQIVAQVPSVATRLDTSPVDPLFVGLVVQIECAMVLRVLNNPTGILEETVDDYSHRMDQAVSSGALYLSDAEKALLGLGDGSSDSAWSVRSPAVPFRSLPSGWPDPWNPFI
jgi:hypothetical protein